MLSRSIQIALEELRDRGPGALPTVDYNGQGEEEYRACQVARYVQDRAGVPERYFIGFLGDQLVVHAPHGGGWMELFAVEVPMEVLRYLRTGRWDVSEGGGSWR
jgi:hypothetical protein